MHSFKPILSLLSCVIVVGCGLGNAQSDKEQKNSDSNSDGKYWYVSPHAKKELWNPAPWLKLENHDKYVLGGAQVPWELSIRRGEESFADALINYKEQVFLSWTKGLKVEAAPLPKRQFRLEFVDDTRGRVKGYEKFLNIDYINGNATTQNVSEFSPLAKRWKERCPVLFQPDSFLNEFPLQVVWTDQNAVYMPKKGVQGFYRSIFETLVDTKTSWDAQTKMAKGETRTPVLQNREYPVIIPAIYLLSEDRIENNPTESDKRKRLAAGNQASWEICGKPQYEWGENCKDGTLFPIDESLSHELGHHVFDTWAAAHGKHVVQSTTFAENMAELFKAVCYGDVSEAPYQIYVPTDDYSNPKFWEINGYRIISPYNPEPFGGGMVSNGAIPWLKYHGMLDTNKIFSTVLKAWEAMDGSYKHKVYCEERTSCPWGEDRKSPLKDQVPNLEWPNGEPRAWSYVEFLDKFIQLYEFETPEMKKGFERILKDYKIAVAQTDKEKSYGWEY